MSKKQDLLDYQSSEERLSKKKDLLDYQPRSEEHLVQVLKERFIEGKFYVNVCGVLVAINPWREKTEENLEKEIKDYVNLGEINVNDSEVSLPPHAITVADNALKYQRKTNRNVSIIPLGESGSGKSHNINSILHYLALRSPRSEQFSRETVFAITGILDSFCNAKTLICNNSTRCVKLYQVFLGDDSSIDGVNLQICLLDKFRLISRISNEENFNIFYQFLNGLSSSGQLQKYFLHDNHRYVRINTESSVEDREHMSLAKTVSCFRHLGFNQEEIECVFVLLSAIILLGDLKFGQTKKKNVSFVVNGDVLEQVSSLLRVPSSYVEALFISKTKGSKGDKVKNSSTCAKAMYERDRVAMGIYEMLVMWIESRINRKHHSRSSHSIFLLDAFGWENYNINFYEQFCINTVNETLQCTYNTIVFSQYKVELEHEGISWDEPFKELDQIGCVPFLFKPKGLLEVLDTSVAIKGTTSDRMLLKEMNAKLKKESSFIANSQELSGFLIQHYIGEVAYDINGFLIKSVDLVNDNALLCLKGSTNQVLSQMAQDRLRRENSTVDRTGWSRGASLKQRRIYENKWFKTDLFLSTSSREKDKKKLLPYGSSNCAILTLSIRSVLERLLSAKVYFIRCINSNIRMEQYTFDDERVVRQVKWSGLFATVQSRSGCFNSSLTLSEFCSRYEMVFSPLSRSTVPSPELCSSALNKYYEDSQFKVGKTKIFMSNPLIDELEKKRGNMFQQAVLIQKVVRGMLGRKKFAKMKKLKNNYDDERSLFFSEVSAGSSKFRDHMSLQLSDDRRRLKEKCLKEEQRKSEEENLKDGSKTLVSGVNPPARRTSYALQEDEVFTDETLEIPTWCKVICFQRTKRLAEFSVKSDEVIIDGTADTFATDRIGFNSFPTPNNDKQMERVKKCIGKGVKLSQSTDGSLLILRLCKNPVFIKGHFCEDMLVERLGELEKHKETKVFDYSRFLENTNYECHPAKVGLDTEDRCLATCAVHICFVKNSNSDEDSPCWVEVVIPRAVDHVQKLVSLGLKRRKEIQEKLEFQQPPALRMDSKMESVSAKVLKLIRPSRYIETVKFNRRLWARKRVKSNPFLFGANSSTGESAGPISVSKPRSSSEKSEVSNTSVSSTESENVAKTDKSYERPDDGRHAVRGGSSGVPAEEENTEIHDPFTNYGAALEPEEDTCQFSTNHDNINQHVSTPHISSQSPLSNPSSDILHVVYGEDGGTHEGVPRISADQGSPNQQSMCKRSSASRLSHGSDPDCELEELTYVSPGVDRWDGQPVFFNFLDETMNGDLPRATFALPTNHDQNHYKSTPINNTANDEVPNMSFDLPREDTPGLEAMSVPSPGKLHFDKTPFVSSPESSGENFQEEFTWKLREQSVEQHFTKFNLKESRDEQHSWLVTSHSESSREFEQHLMSESFLGEHCSYEQRSEHGSSASNVPPEQYSSSQTQSRHQMSFPRL